MSLKERAPARTTPYKRFFCNDCNAKFKARYLANRNTRSTQHYCAVYRKVVTRKVGQKSQKCEAEHDGPCLIERKPTRPGYDSEDEAKANQKRDRKNGLTGKGVTNKAATTTTKRTNNVRLGNGNKSKTKNNKNKSKNKTKTSNKDNSGSDSDSFQSGFLLASKRDESAKQFEDYLYRTKQSKKRNQRQRDDDSDVDQWAPTQAKKKRRKNKNKNKSNNENGEANSPFTGHQVIPVPLESEEEEDFDIASHNHNGNSNNNSNQNGNKKHKIKNKNKKKNKKNKMKTNGINENGVYLKGITKQRPLVTVLKNSAPQVEPINIVPAVLPMNGNNNTIDSDNENPNDIEIDNQNRNGDKNEITDSENENENDIHNEKKDEATNNSDRSNSNNSNSNTNGNNGNIENNDNDNNEDVDDDEAEEEEDDDSDDNGAPSATPKTNEAFNNFVKIYGIATECMKEQNWSEAIRTLKPPLEDSYYQQNLKVHPIYSESYLILAHAYQALEQQDEALDCLENITYFEHLPIRLQIRIKDTEVQLLEYLQRFEDARQAKYEINELQQRTGNMTYYS